MKLVLSKQNNAVSAIQVRVKSVSVWKRAVGTKASSLRPAQKIQNQKNSLSSIEANEHATSVIKSIAKRAGTAAAQYAADYAQQKDLIIPRAFYRRGKVIKVHKNGTGVEVVKNLNKHGGEAGYFVPVKAGRIYARIK